MLDLPWILESLDWNEQLFRQLVAVAKDESRRQMRQLRLTLVRHQYTSAELALRRLSEMLRPFGLPHIQATLDRIALAIDSVQRDRAMAAMAGLESAMKKFWLTLDNLNWTDVQMSIGNSELSRGSAGVRSDSSRNASRA